MSMASPFRRIVSFFVCALVFSLGWPVIAGAAQKLPPGFIAIADSPMTLSEAKAFCRQKGGKLPRVNKSNSLSGDAKQVEGFGAVGDPWPSGLSEDVYWTGTVADDPGLSWLVNNGGDGIRADVFYDVDYTSLTTNVICVP